jgi:acetyl esterase/lipase
MASPELETLIGMMRAAPRNENATVRERREGFEQLASLMPLPPDVRAEKVDVAGIASEWISVDGKDGPTTLLFLHGGGYVIGSLTTHRRAVSDFVRATGGRALLIDYRLAPEHPHPAAVDDAVVAYRWLLAQGIDPQRTVVIGDSAGGGLTAATLLALRDGGDPLPSAGVLLSPWLDLVCDSESMTTKAAVDPMITPTDLHGWADMYASGHLKAPLVSPHYGQLAGLPPLLIQVGSAEVLLDDSTRFAERAKAAGVDVTLEVWDDMIHVWHLFAMMLPEGQQAIDRVAAYIKERAAVAATTP